MPEICKWESEERTYKDNRCRELKKLMYANEKKGGNCEIQYFAKKVKYLKNNSFILKAIQLALYHWLILHIKQLEEKLLKEGI